jgi:hypothetical protein
MQIREITVSAGRTLQHPCETYANLRPEVSLTATLDAGEDAIDATRRLQRQAEQLVEEHGMVLRASIAEREVARREEQELARLTQSLADNQERIETLKSNAEKRQVRSPGLLFDAVLEEANV